MVEEKKQKLLFDDMTNLIKEIIEPSEVDVSSIVMNDELSPLLWDENQILRPEIRKTLLVNAKRFIEFSDIEIYKFSDIILTGSLANYNYGDNSDIDIHIILDFSQISDNKPFVTEYFKVKSMLWEEKIPVNIGGHYIEYYFQDFNDKHHSSGVYSLLKNKWVRKPLKNIINIDTENIKLKASHYINKIEELENVDDFDAFNQKYKELRTKIKRFRQSGLDASGEFSTENLVFKILRNGGYLERLISLKDTKLTQDLSL